jgi:hypothetical protein
MGFSVYSEISLISKQLSAILACSILSDFAFKGAAPHRNIVQTRGGAMLQQKVRIRNYRCFAGLENQCNITEVPKYRR